MSFKKKKSFYESEYPISVGWAPEGEQGDGKPRLLGGRPGSWPTDNCGISQEGVVNFEVKGSEFIMF